MKRKLLSVLPLLLLLTLSVPAIAYAQTKASSMPASVNCGSGCHSDGWWNGNSNGGYTTFTVSNPTIHNTIGYFNRFIRVGIANSYPRVEVGISQTKGAAYGDYCAGAGTGLHYFIYSWLASGNNNYNICFTPPAGDINHDTTFSLIQDNSCDFGEGDYDDMRVFIQSANFNKNECVDTEMATGTRITLQEDIVDTVIGHDVWGSHWTKNTWIDAGNGANYQTRGFDSYIQNNPPQLYWHSAPVAGNNGGELYTCDYDTGTTCTYGS